MQWEKQVLKTIRMNGGTFAMATVCGPHIQRKKNVFTVCQKTMKDNLWKYIRID